MSDGSKQNYDSTARLRRIVRCDQCGRSDECSASDLLRFTRQGWPRCCGQVMAMFTGGEKPASDAPDSNRPPET